MTRGRGRSRSRNLPGAGAGKVKNDRLRQPCFKYTDFKLSLVRNQLNNLRSVTVLLQNPAKLTALVTARPNLLNEVRETFFIQNCQVDFLQCVAKSAFFRVEPNELK